MEQILNEFRFAFTDPAVNETLKSLNGRPNVSFSRHFTQNEEFFIKLAEPFTVPSVPIHHDVRLKTPSAEYLGSLRALIARLTELVPDLFAGLTYVFDPAEILRPAFFHIYRIGDAVYLFILRLDLSFRPTLHEVLARGTNDRTPQYRTDRLFYDADAIPLDDVSSENNKVTAFKIRQFISQTWIGETGRGYFVQGIWLDRELTKFFSKLFCPPGRRFYPYYPFNCKYRSVCMSLIDVDQETRRGRLPLLHRAIQYLIPEMTVVESALKANDFSENLEVYKSLKSKIPESWSSAWGSLNVKAYINEKDMKEFLVEG